MGEETFEPVDQIKEDHTEEGMMKMGQKGVKIVGRTVCMNQRE